MDAKTKALPASAPQKAGDGPKYPHVRVDLAKEDRNPFAILNRTETALRQAGNLGIGAAGISAGSNERRLRASCQRHQALGLHL